MNKQERIQRLRELQEMQLSQDFKEQLEKMIAEQQAMSTSQLAQVEKMYG